MFGNKHAEVLVVGAGPVGLFTALTLTRQGVSVQIVDEEWRTGAHSYALGLHAASIRLLEQAGLADQVQKETYQVNTVGIYDETGRRAELKLSELPGGPGHLAVLRQDALESMLEDALRRAGVHVHWNHRVCRLSQGQAAVKATIDHLEQESLGYAVAHTEWIVSRSREIEVPYLVGADGHLSDVRRSLGYSFDEVGPTQHFAVFEFQTDFDLGHEMRIVLSQGTTNVLWPLPGGYCRWTFELKDFVAPSYSRHKDRMEVQFGGTTYPVLSDESLHEMIQSRAPWFTGSIDDLEWRLVVRFERRLVPQYGNGRMWLAGDAAHITAPGGIQSMNMGLREAHDLSHSLAALLHGKGTAEQLTHYNDQFMAEWQSMFGIRTSPGPQIKGDPWLLQNIRQLTPVFPATGPDLKALTAQLELAAA